MAVSLPAYGGSVAHRRTLGPADGRAGPRLARETRCSTSPAARERALERRRAAGRDRRRLPACQRRGRKCDRHLVAAGRATSPAHRGCPSDARHGDLAAFRGACPASHARAHPPGVGCAGRRNGPRLGRSGRHAPRRASCRRVDPGGPRQGRRPDHCQRAATALIPRLPRRGRRPRGGAWPTFRNVSETPRLPGRHAPDRPLRPRAWRAALAAAARPAAPCGARPRAPVCSPQPLGDVG
jgi:hypothetical protein